MPQTYNCYEWTRFYSRIAFSPDLAGRQVRRRVYPSCSDLTTAQTVSIRFSAFSTNGVLQNASTQPSQGAICFVQVMVPRPMHMR